MPAFRHKQNGTLVEISEDLVDTLGPGWAAADSAWTPAEDELGTDGPPPKSGRGSSDANWTTYARDNGVEVTDEMSRKEVIAACEEAGVPTEA